MKTITLSKPITSGDKTISELTFRDATTGDIMLAEKYPGQMSQAIVMLAAMSDTPLPTFQKIAAVDLKNIMAQTQDLLGNEEADTTGD